MATKKSATKALSATRTTYAVDLKSKKTVPAKTFVTGRLEQPKQASQEPLPEPETAVDAGTLLGTYIPPGDGDSSTVSTRSVILSRICGMEQTILHNRGLLGDLIATLSPILGEDAVVPPAPTSCFEANVHSHLRLRIENIIDTLEDQTRVIVSLITAVEL
jgi:hypothetical protein